MGFLNPTTSNLCCDPGLLGSKFWAQVGSPGSLNLLFYHHRSQKMTQLFPLQRMPGRVAKSWGRSGGQ